MDDHLYDGSWSEAVKCGNAMTMALHRLNRHDLNKMQSDVLKMQVVNITDIVKHLTEVSND